MPSAIQVYIIFFLQLTVILAGEETKHVKKIVIHVPYKIHKHHHTHTKYKIIKVPETKKENTVVYLKDEVKTNPPLQLESFHATDIKAPTFSPPHQESALNYFTDTQNKDANFLHQQYSAGSEDQKTFETNLGIQVQTAVPDYKQEQTFEDHKENLVTDSFYKSSPQLWHHSIPSATLHQPLPLKPDFHHYNKGFHTHYLYYPSFHFPKAFYPKHSTVFTYPSLKTFQDNAAHMSNQVYKTLRAPKAAYQVKEEFHENGIVQPQLENFQKNIQVPSFKVKTEPKLIRKPMHYNTNKLWAQSISQSPEYEYEHVGYLIIDGNSKRVVGKDFKNDINLFR